MIIGTILIAGGAVLIAVFGIVPEPNHSLEDLLQLFRRPTFIAYFSLLAVAIIACLAIVSLLIASRRIITHFSRLTSPNFRCYVPCE